MKLSKAQRKAHGEAESLLSLQRKLTQTEREFCLNHWMPGTAGDVGRHGVFFTPESIASGLISYPMGAVIDACAGIGRLAYHSWQGSMWRTPDFFHITCVECNHTYVEVGKRILPEADWIRADLADYAESLDGKPHFNAAISNPPYGNVPTLKGWKDYKGPAHLVVPSILLDICEPGADISLLIPDTDIEQDFRGRHNERSAHYRRWLKHHPNYHLQHNSCDFSMFANDWVGAKPNVTFVTIDEDEQDAA